MATGIATFGPSDNTNTGITLNGTFGGGSLGGADTGASVTPNLFGATLNQGVLGDSTINTANNAYTAPLVDPTSGLTYDAETGMVNSQLGNLDNQYNVGHQNILDAYNGAYNKLLGDKALGQRNYDTSKAQTLQDYTAARGNNQAQVGQQANSLQRLLGAHGYHGSANQAAGYAAALQGAQVNNGLEKGFGRNQQALDTNWGDYQNQWNTNAGDLGHQRDTQFNGLQAKVDQTKQGLLGQLAQIAAARGGNTTGYTNQINQLGTDVTNLGRDYASPVLQATPTVYQAPSLESYGTSPLQAAQVNQGGAASNVNPFLSVLLGGQDKKNLNGLAA